MTRGEWADGPDGGVQDDLSEKSTGRPGRCWDTPTSIVTRLEGFAAWGVLFKNKMWLWLGSFIYLQQVKETRFTSKALSHEREA